MGLPTPPSPGDPGGSGSSSAGRDARIATGDADILSRVSPDGVPVRVHTVTGAAVLVAAPPTGYVRCVQRAMIHDTVPIAATVTADLYLSTDGAGAVYDELLDRVQAENEAFATAIKTVKARIDHPVFMRGSTAMWCYAQTSGEASARYFDILLRD